MKKYLEMKSIFYPYLIKVLYTTTHVDGEKGNLCANVKGKSIEMTLELWMDIVGLSSVGMIANEKGLEDEEVTFNKLATYKSLIKNLSEAPKGKTKEKFASRPL